MRVLLVGVGGFLGSSARYLAGGVVHRYLPSSFPYGTFLINVTGCLAIGFLGVLAEERGSLGPEGRLFWMIGVVGGYTTFSTFGYETLSLLRDGRLGAALFNAAGQVLIGLAAVWIGAIAAGRLP
jgi:CrcB protein